MQTQTAEAPKAKRTPKTKLFVVYRDLDGEMGITSFDFKDELDSWLAGTNVTVESIVRGVEKKFKTKITLS